MLVAGVDISYKGNPVACAVVMEDFKLIKVRKVGGEVNFPYIPGLLRFREGPLMLKALAGLEFDVLFVDGNGKLHPERKGLATFIGEVLDKPTIGVAKSLLFGEVKGNYVYDGKERIGAVLKTRSRPIYVSVGHKISLEEAVRLTKKYTKYRIPEPIRLAHLIGSGCL
ncbi:MAG: endonuclease V [Nanoarchaeota archaeon]|nr:endonuclease V [Nanoarchaeota archaeon]